jgi:hypothetical protein
MTWLLVIILIILGCINAVLLWFALKRDDIVCTPNGCTQTCRQGRDCECTKPTVKSDKFWQDNLPD